MTVDVRDINDPPIFGEQSTEISVAEVRTCTSYNNDGNIMLKIWFVLLTLQGVTIGTTLERLVAVDNDFGLNSAVSYSLEQIAPAVSMSGTIFSIRPFTGDLVTLQNLVLGIEYQLRVIATVSM